MLEMDHVQHVVVIVIHALMILMPLLIYVKHVILVISLIQVIIKVVQLVLVVPNVLKVMLLVPLNVLHATNLDNKVNGSIAPPPIIHVILVELVVKFVKLLQLVTLQLVPNVLLPTQLTTVMVPVDFVLDLMQIHHLVVLAIV